ncbi:enoyl-CoA hydratase-related protein [Cupriavidus necator]|uniref:enoyl-CoA hydratase/isomerase family protein n=1 Tax=Cupriavidus necator TaxID=106590 RepID=UPI003ED1217C
MKFEDYKAISFARRGRVLYVTLNRPEKLNAVDALLHEELASVFTDCSNDSDSDLIVLTGAGRAFSAGGDIDWMQSAIDSPAAFEKTAREAKQIVFTLLDCEKPVIAKLNGHAAGLGATIALFCDVIFASNRAKIGDPHVSVGLSAGDGGAIIWPQLVGYARAKEYLFTGDLLTADDAARIGLVNHSVDPDQLDARVDAFADRLTAGAIKAIRWTKMTANIALKQVAHAAMDGSIAYESLSNVTQDHQEGVNAFRERRAPVFTGS